MEGLPLWTDAADRGVEIFNNLQLPDVEGKPFLRDACGEWFRRDFVRPLFGSLNPATNERMIREIFGLAPKKSSKTSYGAALMLTALMLNKRPRAEFLLVAPSKLIAELAFSQIKGMIDADEENHLQRRFHVKDYIKTIVDRRTDAQLVIKAFDSNVLTGVKPVGVLIDELHEISKDSAALRILRQIRGGIMANSEGFLIFITTQSDAQPSGVFELELATARNVRDGKSPYPMLPVLYEFPHDIAIKREGEPAAWEDPNTWAMVNPNIGFSTNIGRLHTDFLKAKEDGDAAMVIWASQHLNIEIGLGLRIGGWEGADFWLARAEEGLDLKELLKRCEVVVVGIDGGGLDDLLGLVVLGREIETRRWLVWGRAWAHEIVKKRRKDIAAKLEGFKDVIFVPNDSDADIVEVGNIVQSIEDAGLFPEKHAIGVDQSGITEIVDELTGRDFSADPETGKIIGIAQGWTLTNTIKTAARRLAAGSLVHCGQPMMAWCVSNAKVEPRGNAVTITKATAGSAKIDPLMAMFNAVALMAKNPDAARSVYEDETFFV